MPLNKPPLVPTGPLTPTAPACRAAVVNPDDNAIIGPTRAIWVGFNGDIDVLMVGDTVPVTIPNVSSGTLLPIAVAKVRQTNTSASGILAFF
jgi:hypothetical protein